MAPGSELSHVSRLLEGLVALLENPRSVMGEDCMLRRHYGTGLGNLSHFRGERSETQAGLFATTLEQPQYVVCTFSATPTKYKADVPNVLAP
jgi:hypothetical protein